MGLAADLAKVTNEQTSKAGEPRPYTEYDGERGHIQTGAMEPVTDFDAILSQFGYDSSKVTIVGNPRISRWQTTYRDENMELQEKWLSAYRFNIAPKVMATVPSDIEAIIKSATPSKQSKRRGKAGHWFVFQASDLQIGKRSRDGSTDEIVTRYVEAVNAAVAELDALSTRYRIDGVQLVFPGDCIEGNVSQSGRNLWLTQETITEQTRIFRRLLILTIDAFRDRTGRVYVDVVNGNHDQAQRQQNTYPGDGWATECAIAVADALTLNPKAYKHVEVRVPDRWSGSMTVPVGDTIVTVAHGHQWRKNQAMKWWSEQALHCQPASSAQLLQHGHLHEFQIEQTATRTRIQSPTIDCGSDWYRDAHGADSRRGCLTYLLRGGDVSNINLV